MSNANVQVDERSPAPAPAPGAPLAGLGHARMGHGLAGRGNNNLHHHHKMIKRSPAPKRASHARRDTTNCPAGGLYLWPASGVTIPTNNKTQIAWNADCLPGTSHIDIYFYAPDTSNNFSLPIQTWRNIPTGNRQYTDQIYPEWWGEGGQTTTTKLNINIVPSGNQPWDSSNPLGPIFFASTDSHTPKQPQDKVDSLISVFLAGGSLTPGGKAAAIICPLVVLFVALGVWIRKLHINRNNKTADWAEHLDKRMSRISIDWQRGGDGSSGPVPGSRPASYYVHSNQSHGNVAGRGAGLPQSPALGRSMDGWNNQSTDDAYAGAYGDEMMEQPPRGFSTYDEGNRQSRISFAQSTGGDRVSRISFAGASSADHSKNSMTIPRIGQHGWRRSAVTTDSYYDPDAPAVPKLSSQYARPNSQMRLSSAYADTQDDDLIMSPTQNNGPAQLGHAEVDQMRDSLSVNRAQPGGDDQADHEFRESVLKYPALSFLAEGRNESDGTDMFRDTPEPTESRQAHSPPLVDVNSSNAYINHSHYSPQGGAHALSPEHPMRYGASPSPNSMVSSQTGMAPPVNATSPDDAMKQYAALRAVAGSPMTPGSGAGGSNVMRTLYTPELSAPSHGNNGHGHKPSMNSVAGSSLNEDDVVGYNEMLS